MCAALVCCAFILPKNTDKTASATTAASVEDGIKITDVTPYYWQRNGTPSSDDPATLSNMTDEGLSTGTLTTDDTTITFSQSASDQYGKSIYIDFKVGVTVPAWEEWEVSYDVDFLLSVWANTTWTLSARVYYFMPDNTTEDANDTLEDPNNLTFTIYECATLDPAKVKSSGVNAVGSLSFNETFQSDSPLTLTNDSDTPKLFTFRYGMNITTCSSSKWTLGINACNATLKNRSVSVKELSVSAPADLNYDYDGSDKTNQAIQDIESSDWYTHNNDIWYTPGQWADYVLPNGAIQDVKTGGYEVTATLKDKYPFKLADGTFTNEPQKFKININPKKVAVPTIIDSEQVYKGTEYEFGLDNNYMSAVIDVSRPGWITESGGTYSDGLVWDPSNKQFKAKNAGEYEVIFKLKNTKNYVWNIGGGLTSDQTSKIVIKKKPLSFTYTATNASMEWGLRESGSVTLIPTVCSGDNVGLSLSHIQNGDESTKSTKGITGNVLDVSQLSSTGAYTLCAELIADEHDANYGSNANYEISGDGVYKMPVNITVKAGGVTVNSLSWQYRKTGEAIDSPLIQGGSQVKLEYNKDKAYFVTASGNADMEVYATYNDDGYINGYKTTDVNGNAVTDCRAAGKYKTRVAVHILNAEYAFDSTNMLGGDAKYGWLELEWEISQKEVDFSLAEWEYSYDLIKWYSFGADGDPEYDSGGVYVRIKDSYIKDLGLDSGDPDSLEIAYDIGMYSGMAPAGAGYALLLEPKGNGYTIGAELTVNDCNYTTVDGNIQNVQYRFDITAQKITVTWSQTGLSFNTQDGVSNTYGISKAVDRNGNDCSALFEYEFTFSDKDSNAYGPMGLADAQKFFAENASNTKVYTGTVKAVLKNSNDYVFHGSDNHAFTVGMSLPTIKITVTGSGGEYKEIAFGFSAEFNGTPYGEHLNVSVYMYDEYYNGGDALITKSGSESSQIAEFLNTLDAGKYVITVTAKDGTPAANFVISPDVTEFEITKKALAVPALKDGAELIFNGDTQQLEPMLDNFDSEYMEFAANSINEGRDAGNYKAVINIKAEYAGNYIFAMPAAVETPVKFALADDGAATDLPEVTDGGRTAAFKWSIGKYVIDTTVSGAWNFGKNGASLNLPNWLTALTTGAEPSLVMRTLYYDTEGKPLENVELKGGSKYIVAAYIDPACADAGNVEFKNQTVDPMTGLTTTPQTTYTVPKSGAAAFVGNVKDFVTKTWLGLPIWAWLAIGLAVLILLIIIIAVACKRRKSKEQRAEEKARREEERRLQQERIEAERELARAKQEAELEKIRAQANMANAGMAATAMAMQQPAQQVQQPMPVPVQQPQTPVQQPMQAMQQPVQASGGSSFESLILEERLRAAEERARYAEERIARAAEERARYAEERTLRAAEERARLAEEQLMRSAYMNRIPAAGGGESGGVSLDALGALVLAALKNYAGGEQPEQIAPAEQPQMIEASSQTSNVPTVYPPDAVITTTTTVDTTQKPLRRERGESDVSGFSDLDGFYDAYTEK